MSKTLAAVLALACAGALYAQAPADKAKAAEKKPAATVPAAVPAAAQPEVKKAAAPAPAKPAAKPADESEESVVMIDSKAEAEDRRASYGEETDDQAFVPDGIPSSLGQCKGVMNEGGRNVLVFESIEDGTISFVHVTIGKATVSWNVIAKIPRSNQ